MITTTSRITALAGIGPKKAELFKKLGVETVGDLLRKIPRGYQHRGAISTLAEAGASGETSAMLLTVGTRPSSALLKNRKVITKFSAFDDTGRCEVVFFNQNYIKEAFSPGAIYRFWGKLVYRGGKWTLTSPQFEPFSGARPLPDYVPVYALASGLSQKTMRATIGIALASLDRVEEVLPKEIRERYRLLSLKEAFYALHSPLTMTSLVEAKRYFVFEELFLFALAIASAKREREGVRGYRIALDDREFSHFLDKLPFTLTNAQARAIADIRCDLASGYAMHRLVSGDVGSGKTVIAAAAVFTAVKGGYQAAMMAPTEILARQHFADLSPLFESLGIRTALLVGALTPAKKRALYEALFCGDIDFVIGTHALLSEGVKFARSALMITDEQHRFGIRQRATLAEKTSGDMALHTLVMSATPIPRTLALAMYGDMAVSTVNELPPGRKKVSTFLVDDSYRARLNGFIVKQAEEGRQVYVVCPAIEEEPDEEEDGALVDFGGTALARLSLHYAIDYANELAGVMPTVTVGCLHGKMSSKEKDAVMNAFESGDIQVLVSTTVIEVGVNVPNATLMVIENADRFGLSQLHQLRGRVGRGSFKSWCILVSNTDNEESLARLRALCQTNNGYEIAEYDLVQRGPGDFLTGNDATRQSGAISFRIASQCDDPKLFASAFGEAESLIKEDPTLSGYPETKTAMLEFLRRNDSAVS